MRVIFGIQPIREAIRAHGSRVHRVLVVPGSPQLDALARFARDQGIEVSPVTKSELDRRAKGTHHQGAAAEAPDLAIVDLASLDLPDDAVIVALDEIQDPQNFGAIVRSAVAMGTHAVMWPEHGSAPLSPAMARASAGAVEHATLCRVPALPSALQTLRERFLVIGLDAQAGEPLAEMDMKRGVVLVVGAEGKGLRRPVKDACSTLARLPLRGPLASLNASVAAAIALYEVTRQRA